MNKNYLNIVIGTRTIYTYIVCKLRDKSDILNLTFLKDVPDQTVVYNWREVSKAVHFTYCCVLEQIKQRRMFGQAHSTAESAYSLMTFCGNEDKCFIPETPYKGSYTGFAYTKSE